MKRRIEQAAADVRQAPSSAAAWGRLGGILDVHDLPAEAVFCYDRAESIDPVDYRWPYFAGICLHLADRLAALERFTRAAELRGDYVPIQVHLGRMLLFSERLDEAELHFRKAVGLDASCIRAHIGMARVSLARGAARAAAGHLDRAIKLGPKQGEVQRLYSEAYRRLGDFEAARRAARVAAEGGNLEPLADPVRFQLSLREGVSIHWRRKNAAGYEDAGRLDEAVAVWEEALDADPRSPDAHFECARLLAAAGRPDSAIDHYQAAISLGRKSADGYNALGALLAGRGRRQQAIASFETALRIDPGFAEARGNLGSLLVRVGRTEEGISQLGKACEAMPENADALFNFAMALMQGGRTAEAVESLRRVLAIQPDHPHARRELDKAQAP